MKSKSRGRPGPEDKKDEDKEGIVYEADQRHVDIIVREMGLTEAGAMARTSRVKVKVAEAERFLTDGRE